MKTKTILLCLLMAAGAIIGGNVNAQSLFIRMTDGSEDEKALNTLRSLTFASNDLLVNLLTGSTDSYGLSLISKLTFNTTMGIENNDTRADNQLDVFPNPGSKLITVKGIPADAGSVTLYSLDGRPVMKVNVNTENAVIDISSLRPGLYIILALDRTAKFVRQ